MNWLVAGKIIILRERDRKMTIMSLICRQLKFEWIVCEFNDVSSITVMVFHVEKTKTIALDMGHYTTIILYQMRTLAYMRMYNLLYKAYNSFSIYDIQSVSRIWASLISRWWFEFRLKPIFNTAPAASKNNVQFRSGQN